MHKLSLCLLLFFAGYPSPAVTHLVYTKHLEAVRNTLESEVKQFGNVPFLLEALQNTDLGRNLTEGCVSALVGILESAIQGNFTEFLDYIDADGKPGPGIASGNYFLLGSFAECQNLPASHYCLVSYDLSLPQIEYTVQMPIGLCTPKHCTNGDVNHVIKFLSAVIRMRSKSSSGLSSVEFGGHDTNCIDGVKYTIGNIIALTVCGFIILLSLVCTIVDLGFLKANEPKGNAYLPVSHAEVDPNLQGNYIFDEDANLKKNGDARLETVQKKQESVFYKLILCFSLAENCRIILDTKLPAGGIGCINGIRTISLTWIIAGHGYIYALTTAMDDSLLSFKVTKKFVLLPFVNAYVAVDSFFLLSGLLVSYLSMQRYERKGRFPWLMFYVHRYLRLTPVYALIIFLSIYLYPVVGTGPLWQLESGGNGISNCKEYWWTNLLYINNFYSQADQCFEWSWYLANDMQFYVITPIILIAMYHLKTVGLLLTNGILLLASFITTALLIHYYHLDTLLTADLQSLSSLNAVGQYTDVVYEKPYCRISAYLVGVILGYILFRQKGQCREYGKPVNLLGWITAIVVGALVVYGPWRAYKIGGSPFSDAENVFYGTFQHVAWAVAVAWVIYACHNGQGGIIGQLLSWRGFIPMSRLTYCAYLVHPIIIKSYFSSLDNPFHFTTRKLVYLFFSFMTMAYGVAFAFAVLVEYPLMAVEKLIFKR